MPTIGLGTLVQMHAAGGTCLAIEAGKTIIIDQAEVVRYADSSRHRRRALECAEQALPGDGNLAA